MGRRHGALPKLLITPISDISEHQHLVGGHGRRGQLVHGAAGRARPCVVFGHAARVHAGTAKEHGGQQGRDLAGVVKQEEADMGVLVSLEPPTPQMRSWAAGQGFYESPWGKHPRLQLLTVGELLEGKRIDYPQTAGVNRTYKQAPKVKKVAEKVRSLFDKDEPAE